MLDVDDLVALGQGVVGRRDLHELRHEPVAAVEDQRQPGLDRRADVDACGRGARQRQPLAAGLAVGFAQFHRRRRDVHRLFRRAGQHHAVGGQHQASSVAHGFEHPQQAGHGVDQHAGGVAVEHVDRDVGHVLSGRRHVDQAAVAAAVVGHHRDRLAIGTAADIEGVAAAAAHQLEQHIGVGADDVEVVVAFQRIDQHLLDAGKADVEAGAVDTAVSDHEVVAELGADDGQRVEAVAALHLHRGVDGVADLVGAPAAVDVGDRRLRVFRVHRHEGAHLEGVVVVLAVHQQVGEVAVDDEAVVAGAAEQRGGVADAIAQPALRDLGGGDPVFGRQAGQRVARRLEDLADLEGVVAGVTVDGHDAAVVVEHEAVVAVAPEHRHAAIDLAVVVEPLADRAAVSPHGHDGVRAKEEGVVAVGAEDLERVDAKIIGRCAVVHVDDRVAGAGQRDAVLVAAGLATQRQQCADAVLVGLGHAVGGVADVELVVAQAAVEAGDTADAAQVDAVVAAAQRHRGAAGVGVGHRQPVGAGAQAHIQALEALVEKSGPGHAEAAEAVAAQGAHLVGRGGGVVDQQAVAAAGTIQVEPAADQRHRGIAGRRAQAEAVVGALAHHRHRAAGGGREHVEAVAGAAQQDLQLLQGSVGDGGRAQAGEGLVSQLSGADRGVGRVVEQRAVGAAAAVQQQQGIDQVQRAGAARAGRAADAEHVVAALAEDLRAAVDAVEHEAVVAVATPQHQRCRRVAGLDGHRVGKRRGVDL